MKYLNKNFSSDMIALLEVTSDFPNMFFPRSFYLLLTSQSSYIIQIMPFHLFFSWKKKF